jgi:hypothetical protein
MDNAKNNDTFISSLEDLLKDRVNMAYNSSQHRIMCFPHIVHICVTHVVKQYYAGMSSREGKEDFDDDFEMDEPEDTGGAILAAERMENDFDTDSGESDEALADIPEGPPCNELQQTYQEAFRRKPLDLVRRIVRAIRSSNQRWEFLKQLISDGNKSGRFKDASGKTIKVPLLHLLLDVKTRWDSTYLMIERFLAASLVCEINFFSMSSHTADRRSIFFCHLQKTGNFQSFA